MSQRIRNWLILLGIATLTLAADRASKWLITEKLAQNQTWHPPIPLVQRILSLTYTTNSGAAFGLFPDQGVFFAIIAIVVVMVIILYYRHIPAGYDLARLALGLQLGGALGNLIDRFHQGFVVDFIDLNFWPLHNWPVFNLADSAIVVGVGILALAMLREDIKEEVEEAESSETDAAGEPSTPS